MACNAILYLTFIEYDQDDNRVRRYSGGKFFTSTQDSLFEKSFLETVTLDLTLLNGWFHLLDQVGAGAVGWSSQASQELVVPGFAGGTLPTDGDWCEEALHLLGRGERPPMDTCFTHV